MDNENRGFRGIWIPANIWLDERLSPLDKIILAEIDSLDNGEKGCFASNESLAKFCQCGVTKVSTAISKLCDLGYVESVSFDGRTRTLKSRLSENETLPFKNCKTDSQNLKPYNIIDNIDYNSGDTPPPSLAKTDYKKFADTYNSVCTNLPKIKVLTDQRKTAIRIFLKTFSFEDFEEICKKANQSNFLRGKNTDRNWKADFDFIIKPKSAAKILEGSYDDAPADSGLPKWN